MTHDNGKSTRGTDSFDAPALEVGLMTAELLGRVKETAQQINERIRKVAGDTHLDLQALAEQTRTDIPPLPPDDSLPS